MKSTNKLFKSTALIVALFVFTEFNLSAQTLQISFDISSMHGYNVSCHGSSDGTITANVTGGSSPYTYLWNTGVTTASISGRPAGTYVLTVTDVNSVSKVDSAILIQPNTRAVSLSAPVGPCNYNLSKAGAADGTISSTVSGGVSSYYYLWSNGSQDAVQYNLDAGAYTLTITDENGCITTANTSLTEPDPILITDIAKSQNGSYNVSCVDGTDGSIEVTVTGGSPPYHYMWTGGPDNINVTDTIGSINNLQAGTYHLYFWACAGGELDSNITLTAPASLNITTTRFVHSNGDNVTCANCADGFISASVTGGISPYTYQWKDTSGTVIGTADTLSGLLSGVYTLTVIDANSCSAGSGSITLNSPAPLWSLTGNTGTGTNNFIGTKDSSDVIFKVNNNESLRMKANGEINFPGFSGNEQQFIYTDSLGNLKSTPVIMPYNACINEPVTMPWLNRRSNPVDVFNCWQRFGLGTSTPHDLLEVKSAIRVTAWNSTTNDDYIRITHTGLPTGSASIDNYGAGDLNINYDNPKNVNICTGNSGNVTLGGNNYFSLDVDKQVGIGTNSPAVGFKLDVNGNAKADQLQLTGLANTSVQNDIVTVDQSGNLSHTNLSTSGLGLWTLHSNGFDIYNSTAGDVGISCENPLELLQIGDRWTFHNGGTKLIGYNYHFYAGASWRILSDVPVATLGFDDQGTVNISTSPAGPDDAPISLNSRFFVSNTGNIGIGTTVPKEATGGAMLDVRGKLNLQDENSAAVIYFPNSGTAPNLYIRSDDDPSTYEISSNRIELNSNGTFHLYGQSGSNLVELFKVNSDGRAFAKSMKVTTGTFVDYVFNEDYNLMPLESLNDYIKTNHHLPEIPSAAEVENDGLDLGDMEVKLVKKIEELTLYVIEQNKKIVDQDRKITRLQKSVENIKSGNK